MKSEAVKGKTDEAAWPVSYSGQECCSGGDCDQSQDNGYTTFSACQSDCASDPRCIGIEYGVLGQRCKSEDTCKCWLLINGVCSDQRAHSGYDVYLNPNPSEAAWPVSY